MSGIEWGIGGLLASIIYGGGSAFLVWDLGNGGLTTAILAGGGVFLTVGIFVVVVDSIHVKVDRYNRNINERISDAEIRIREMVNVRPLIDGPPLDFEGWTMSPHFGKLIAQIVSRHHPDTVVECGSGTSTVFTAHALNKYNISGDIYALEHTKKYKEKTDNLIQDHSCESRAGDFCSALRAQN